MSEECLLSIQESTANKFGGLNVFIVCHFHKYKLLPCYIPQRGFIHHQMHAVKHFAIGDMQAVTLVDIISAHAECNKSVLSVAIVIVVVALVAVMGRFAAAAVAVTLLCSRQLWLGGVVVDRMLGN